MTDDESPAIERIRRFDRFCESRVRMAARALAIEDFSFADIGVLTELAWIDGGACGAWLCYRLGLDTGYLCRVLKKLDASGLVVSRDSSTDARKRIWNLAELGRRVVDSIEEQHQDRALMTLDNVFPAERDRLLEAMAVVEAILGRA